MLIKKKIVLQDNFPIKISLTSKFVIFAVRHNILLLHLAGPSKSKILPSIIAQCRRIPIFGSRKSLKN